LGENDAYGHIPSKTKPADALVFRQLGQALTITDYYHFPLTHSNYNGGQSHHNAPFYYALQGFGTGFHVEYTFTPNPQGNPRN
jgi:hypothetical protein